MQLAVLRLRVRGIVVIAMTLALMLGTLAAPARAGDDIGDDLESARASALETIDGKINSLIEMRSGAQTDQAWAIYSEGIEALHAKRARVADEDNVAEIQALREQAIGIYNETVAAAAAADEEPGDPVAEAREAALNKINSKLIFFRERKAGTNNPDHLEIYAWAIGELEELKARAQISDSADELWNLKAQAHEIYESALYKIDKAGDGEGDKNDDEQDQSKDREQTLGRAKEHTLALIEMKTALLRGAAESAHRDAVSDIYRHAAEAVWALTDDAREARSIDALRAIEGQLAEICEAAKQAVSELGRDEGQDPRDAIAAELEQLARRARHLMERVEATAKHSPDTAEAAMAAGETLLAAIAQAAEADTEEDMVEAWAAVRDAKHAFRLALIAHHVAILDVMLSIDGEPFPI